LSVPEGRDLLLGFSPGKQQELPLESMTDLFLPSIGQAVPHVHPLYPNTGNEVGLNLIDLYYLGGTHANVFE
jgi:hypothetical protein